MSAFSRFCRKLGAACIGLIAVTLPLAARASTIGLYTDETGSSCSFSGNNPGLVTAYVMVRPDERGLHGVRFSAPIPSCLGAVFVEEFKPVGGETIGDSQTGISVAWGTCATGPRVALQINYYRSGSTEPCCAFPIAADPFVEMIEGVDCNHGSLTVDPVVSHFNADASCECTQPANLAPLTPSEPAPASNQLAVPLWSRLAWQCSDPEGEPVTYTVYFGDHNPPPQVASDVWGASYDVGPLLYATQYYWRVVARDPHGRETEAPVWTFRTIANPPPGAPSNPSPKMEAANQPLSLTLVWSCWDVDGETITYDVYFGDSDSPPLVAENVTGSTYDPGPLAPVTNYRWRIVAHDSSGGESAGPTWSFSTLVVSSFAVVAINEGVRVEWRLTTDDGMESYTLYRTEVGTSNALAVAHGAVSGATGSFLDSSVKPGSNYRYELTVVSASGQSFRSSTARISAKFPELELGPNHPNPFNPQTTIPYFLMVGGHTRLAIYDAAGRRVRTLVDGHRVHGSHEVVWNGADDTGVIVSSGVYFAVLEDAAGERQARKLVMVK